MKRDLRPSKNSNEISLSQSARNAKNWAKLWKAIENDKGKALKRGYPDRFDHRDRRGYLIQYGIELVSDVNIRYWLKKG